MPIMDIDQESNLVEDWQECQRPFFIFALNIEGDHEGGFASRVIGEMEVEKFAKTGPLKWGQVVKVEDEAHGIVWYGIACYSLGSVGWDNAKDALLNGLQSIFDKEQWDDLEWERKPFIGVQLPGGDKVGRMQGADPYETMAAFAEFDGKFIIYNG